MAMKTAYEHSMELIKEVIPTMTYKGEDFCKWKQAARRKLFELLKMEKFNNVESDIEIEFEKEHNNSTEIRFTFNTEKGFRSIAHLVLPKGVVKPPVMICLQGHSTGMHISLGKPKFAGDEESISGGDRDFVVRAVEEGFAAVALEQRNFGELGGDENGSRCFESSMTALLMGRTTLGERVWDIMKLIDVLESDFSNKIDTDTICCMGNSGGGTATIYAAALEDRIKLAMPSCAMCTYKDSIGAMHHCSCNYVPTIAEFFDMGDLMAMAYPKYFIQVSGKEDPIFPINGAMEVFGKGKAVYEHLGAGCKCFFVEGNGGHRFYADDSWPIVHKVIGK